MRDSNSKALVIIKTVAVPSGANYLLSSII